MQWHFLFVFCLDHTHQLHCHLLSLILSSVKTTLPKLILEKSLEMKCWNDRDINTFKCLAHWIYMYDGVSGEVYFYTVANDCVALSSDIDNSDCCCHWQSPGGSSASLSAGDGADLWSNNRRLSQACLPSVRCRGISALEIAAEQVSTTRWLNAAWHIVNCNCNKIIYIVPPTERPRAHRFHGTISLFRGVHMQTWIRMLSVGKGRCLLTTAVLDVLAACSVLLMQPQRKLCHSVTDLSAHLWHDKESKRTVQIVLVHQQYCIVLHENCSWYLSVLVLQVGYIIRNTL